MMMSDKERISQGLGEEFWRVGSELLLGRVAGDNLTELGGATEMPVFRASWATVRTAFSG